MTLAFVEQYLLLFQLHFRVYMHDGAHTTIRDYRSYLRHGYAGVARKDKRDPTYVGRHFKFSNIDHIVTTKKRMADPVCSHTAYLLVCRQTYMQVLKGLYRSVTIENSPATNLSLLSRTLTEKAELGGHIKMLEITQSSYITVDGGYVYTS